MLLCEGAGHDIVLLETVGLGQSEVLIDETCDMLLLVVPPAGGDELQGVKKGIMEVADMVVVNKADGELMVSARHSAADFRRALQLVRPKYEWWTPKVRRRHASWLVWRVKLTVAALCAGEAVLRADERRRRPRVANRARVPRRERRGGLHHAEAGAAADALDVGAALGAAERLRAAPRGGGGGGLAPRVAVNGRLREPSRRRQALASHAAGEGQRVKAEDRSKAPQRLPRGAPPARTGAATRGSSPLVRRWGSCAVIAPRRVKLGGRRAG